MSQTMSHRTLDPAGRRRKSRPGLVTPESSQSPEAESPSQFPAGNRKRSRRRERSGPITPSSGLENNSVPTSYPTPNYATPVGHPTLSELAAISSQLLDTFSRDAAETTPENSFIYRRRPSQIRVKKDNWRRRAESGPPADFSGIPESEAIERSESPESTHELASEITHELTPDITPEISREASPAEDEGSIQQSLEDLSPRDRRLQAERDAQLAQERALRYVRAAERDRQRLIQLPQYDTNPPPLDEYNCVDEDIPPYQAHLHRYLDLISYDERFAPVLRVNRYLVPGDGDLSVAITKFSKFNLLPQRTDLWSISHVDDNDYEHLIPALIPEESY